MSGGGQIVMYYKPVSDWGNNHWGQFQWNIYSSGSPNSAQTNFHAITGATAPMGTVTTGIDGVNGNGRWQKFAIHISQWEVNGTGADLTHIIRFALFYRGTSGFQPAAFIGDVVWIPDQRPRGAVVFSFDDGYTDALLIAKPILDQVGAHAMIYPSAWLANGPYDGVTYMTLAQAQSLVAAGWQIGGQGYQTETNTIVDGWTTYQRVADIVAQRSKILALGDAAGGADGSNFSNEHWGGNSYLSRADYMANFRSCAWFLLGAAVNPYVIKYAQPFPIADPYITYRISGSGTAYATPTAGYNAAVDGAVATKGVAHIMLHHELSQGGGGFTAADYQAAMQSIVTRLQNNPGQFDILTMKELYAPFMQPPYLNFLLRRDIDPASNDNDPMWLEKAA
jgi:peptidoglycan/xylan/chitin deacetylase (PgdA/CDA1 family)